MIYETSFECSTFCERYKTITFNLSVRSAYFANAKNLLIKGTVNEKLRIVIVLNNQSPTYVK